MRKGIKINTVIIDDTGHITALDQHDNEIKTSRQQRKVLSNYTDKDYIQKVCSAFDNPTALSKDFYIIRK